MKPPETIRKHLDEAHSLQGVLAAGWEAFDLIRQIATDRAHGTHGSYATWMSVIPPACEGKEALGRAPSLPPDQDQETAPEDYATDDQAAHDVAALAKALGHRLQAGDIAHDAADQQAMELAGLAAAEILGLLADGD
jgi:hypothetical protein